MAEPLQPPQGVGAAVLGLEYHHSPEGLHQAALPGDSELGGKVAVYMGDHMDAVGGYHGEFLLSLYAFLPSWGTSAPAMRRKVFMALLM